MSDNILNILGVAYKEDVISNLLVEIINKSEMFREKFFQVIGADYVLGIEVEAKTRIATSSYGIPDIVIRLEGQAISTLIIIENKLKAEEGDEQTSRYSEKGCIDEIIKIMNFKNTPKFIGIFLTLVKEEPTGEKFLNMTYESILKECSVNLENPILDILYKNLTENLKDFYSNLDICNTDKILSILNENIEPQKLYIKFRNIIESIKFSEGISVYVGKAGGKGRISCITQLTKDAWTGDCAEEKEGLLYYLSENTYNIHLEGAFDIINKRLSLALHYETNPYVPKSKLLENTSEICYEKYTLKREKIKDYVHIKIGELKNDNIKPYNGFNQIASINITVDENSTVEDFKNTLLKNVDIITKIIDEAITKGF